MRGAMRWFSFLFLVSGAALTAMSAAAPGPTPPPAAPSPKAVEAANRFGFDLYREILRGDRGHNLFISPLSVSLALSMAANGAAGTTRDAMLHALRAQSLTIEELNRSAGGFLFTLENPDPKVRLTIANSLWARKGMTFKDSFLEINRADYEAEVRALDFADAATPGVINAWVSEKTNGKIPSMVDRIDPDEILFILNAIWFKGQWTREFDKAKTRDLPFTLGDGTKIQVPMMTQTGEYSYFKGDGFAAVSLPYGNGRIAFVAVVPDEGKTLDGLQDSLSAESWSSWTSSLHRTDGTVVLPRFKMEYQTSLVEALTSMGMGEAFDAARADFTAMIASRQVAISRVKHKAFVEVNEEGTEAAAATSIGIRLTSMVASPFRIVFDRPFFLAIRDTQTGAVLFMGTVRDPR